MIINELRTFSLLKVNFLLVTTLKNIILPPTHFFFLTKIKVNMLCQAECNGGKKGTDSFKVEPTRSSCYFLCRLGLFTESTSMHWALTLQDLCEALCAAL